jgi:hypothetical protein
MKQCLKCKEEKPLSEFYIRNPKTKTLKTYCKKCDMNNTIERQQLVGSERKLYLISLCGGKCSICGYNKCMASLSFHHVIPSDKSMQLSIRELSNHSLKTIEEEAKKCVLLCLNCHSELHYNEHNRLDSYKPNKHETTRKTCKCGKVIPKTNDVCSQCK